MEPTQEQIKELVAALNKATLKEVITIEAHELITLPLPIVSLAVILMYLRMDISPEIVKGILSLW